MVAPEVPFWGNELVHFVAPETDDIALIASWWADRAVMERNIPMPLEPKSTGEITFRVQQRINDPDEWFWMIVANDTQQHIGTVALQLINRLARVGRVSILIGTTSHRGRGLGEAALSLLLKFGFLELDLQRIELNVLATNAAAIRLYRRLGFRQEGIFRSAVYRHGQRIDWLQMGFLRDEWEDKP